MSGFFGGSIFGASGNNWMSGMSSLYSDYNSIRNGSYYKLLKSYYGQNSSSSKTSSKTDDVVSKKTNVENKELKAAKADANELQKSAQALTATGSKSLFQKKEITTKDEDGKETKKMDYDRSAIEKAVTSFVNDYNSTIESAGDVSSLNILRKTQMLTQMTASNKKMLSEVGINITSGNKLSVDKETLQNADINKLKTLFEGRNSYAGMVADKASQISLSAVAEASRSSSLYTNSGSYYSKQNNSLFDSLY